MPLRGLQSGSTWTSRPALNVVPDHHGRQLDDADPASAASRSAAMSSVTRRGRCGISAVWPSSRSSCHDGRDAAGRDRGWAGRRDRPAMTGRAATSSGLATRHCVLSSSLRMTRSVGSSGGKRTRMATSNPFGDHIDAAVGAFQMHLDGRVLGHEARDQTPRTGSRAARRRTAHPHHAARLGADLRRSTCSAASASTSMATQRS